MGGLCSRSLGQDYHEPEKAPSHAMAERNDELYGVSVHAARDSAAAERLVNAHEANILSIDPRAGIGSWHTLNNSADGQVAFRNADDYFAERARLLGLEQTLDFDHTCRMEATPLERRVDAIIGHLKRHDADEIYSRAEARKDIVGQQHPRFAGDHFLSNVDLIHTTRLFKVARKMPKGGHLHIHFNACLKPHVLLDIAKNMDRMFITSTLPLVSRESVGECEIQFSMLTPEKETPGNLFHPDYERGSTMRFQDFLEQFEQFPRLFDGQSADMWLESKIVFKESEAYNPLQTATGAWEKFNGRTRMMKGLFNYETAYRKYTRLCLENFLNDNIQYAEIRPTFMASNQLYYDNGEGPIDNSGIMGIIIDEVEKFQAQATSEGRFFGGLKVIYCTPRSFQPSSVEAALEQCLRFKEKWPKWIAGFAILHVEVVLDIDNDILRCCSREGQHRDVREFLPDLSKCLVIRAEIMAP